MKEILNKIEVYKRKMKNLAPDDARYISSEGIVMALEWVINHKLYKGAEE